MTIKKFMEMYLGDTTDVIKINYGSLAVEYTVEDLCDEIARPGDKVGKAKIAAFYRTENGMSIVTVF